MYVSCKNLPYNAYLIEHLFSSAGKNIYFSVFLCFICKFHWTSTTLTMGNRFLGLQISFICRQNSHTTVAAS